MTFLLIKLMYWEGYWRFIRAKKIGEQAFYLMSDFGEIICKHTVVADSEDKAKTLLKSVCAKIIYIYACRKLASLI